MAQLVKLMDYISRYEANPFHYPTQYIRLKQEHWQTLIAQWEEENELEAKSKIEEEMKQDEKPRINWNPFSKKEKSEEVEYFIRDLPRTKQQLTHYFLNELFPFQLKWATSTLSQMSFTDKKFEVDRTLKSFLQRLPDIYLLMYQPIFNIKNAPVEGETILISPLGIEIITVIEHNPAAQIVVKDERTWELETETMKQKIISPMIALKRTEQIVRSILKLYEVDVPIQKVVMSEVNDFMFASEPYKTRIVGKYEYEGWLKEKRDLYSPLKSKQLRVLEALLKHCQTTSIRRPEWETDPDKRFEV